MVFLVRGALRDVLEESLGSEHVMVISKLDKPMLDSNLSDKVRLDDTRVRSILNDLHDKRLVNLRRTKGPKEGWYSYYWSRREDNILEFASKYLDSRLSRLSIRVNANSEDMLYSCDCSTVDYGKAIETNFVCGSCGQKFMNERSPKEIREINSEIKRLNELKRKTLSLT
jgi:transcription factor E